MVKTGIILILFESDFSFLQNKLPHEEKKKGYKNNNTVAV